MSFAGSPARVNHDLPDAACALTVRRPAVRVPAAAPALPGAPIPMRLAPSVRWLRMLGAFGLATQLLACGAERLDFVVVVIDTLRADRVGAYGSRTGLTPHLDALAALGVVFERAYAQSSWTNPSVASLLTSRYQSQHGITTVLTVLPEAETTLPEVLWLNGWETAGFSANAGISKELGFSQGYKRYEAYPHHTADESPIEGNPVRADVVNTDALAWLDAQPAGKPIFLWLQYMEPHFPYLPAEPLPALDGAPCPNPVEHGMIQPGGPPPSPELMRAVALCYDAEVTAADAAVGAIVDALRRRSRLDHTVLIVTADHGEEMLEHGRVGHGLNLYEEVIRVPLIVATPWQRERRDVDEIVRLVDVAPTILSLAGIAVPKSFEGRSFADLLGRPPGPLASLRALWSSETAPPADGAICDEAFTELLTSPAMKQPRKGQHLMALVEGEEKMIVPEGDVPPVFYDLAQDPGEHGTRDLPPASRDRLQRALGEALEQASRNPTTPSEEALDADTRRRLQMLGYVQ
jgi:arylsulfatase A-like enzyme